MLEFYHVSDLHLGGKPILRKPRTTRVKLFLEKLYDQFGFKDATNKYLIVTGDITNSGEVEEYRDALKIFNPFKGKIFFVPGNHDYGYVFSWFYDDARAKRFDSTLKKEFFPDKPDFFEKKVFVQDIVTEKGKVLLIGLNSCLKLKAKGSLPHQKFGQSVGLLGYKQLDELKELFERRKNDGFKKIVFIHHIPDNYADELLMCLFDFEDLIEITGPYTDVYCYGHQGEMAEVAEKGKAKTLVTPISARSMEVRQMNIAANIGVSYAKRLGLAGPAINKPWSLDANQSVDKSACYKISIIDNVLKRPEILPVVLD